MKPAFANLKDAVISSGWTFVLSLLIFVFLLPGEGNGAASKDLIPIRLISIVTLDDSGLEIGLPSSLVFDPVAQETYVLSGAGQVTVYDRKFFPIISFGEGRGLQNPIDLDLDRKGNLYVIHGREQSDFPLRITIFNQAFFPERSIIFSEIAGLEDFIPRRIAVAPSGDIYLVGIQADNYYGALVLDSAGNVKKWLRPVDVGGYRAPAVKEKVAAPVVPDQPEAGEAGSAGATTVPDLPDSLKPAVSEEEPEEEESNIGLVRLDDVEIDRNGRVYLLSRDLSHIYTYDSNGELLFTFGEKGGADRKLSNPVSLAIDFDRRIIYVCDYMRHTILCYDYDTGKYVFEFGGRGTSPLWFNFPAKVAVDDQGQVIVADLFNRRVQVVDPNMRARRPLAGDISPEIAGGQLPAPVEKMAQPDKEQEPETAVVEPAGVLAPGPVIAAMMVPSVPKVPEVPIRLAGIESMPSSLVPAGQKVPQRPQSPPPKLIRPTRFKKAVEHLPVVAVIVPEIIPEPVIVAVPEKDAVVSTAEPTPMQRILRLPASLGVYGPVAALGLLGGWFLYRNK